MTRASRDFNVDLADRASNLANVSCTNRSCPIFENPHDVVINTCSGEECSMVLHGYWRSGAAYRVRIALNLKGLAYTQVSVHLIKDGGAHNSPAYKALNPQGRVPTLVLDDGTALIQSPAILEYLEEAYPVPALLPPDMKARARVRGIASVIGADVHPLGNVGPLNYLRQNFGADTPAVKAWVAKWVGQGFAGIEAMIDGGDYCAGDRPTLADVYLIPQVYGAKRFDVPLDAYPKIMRVAAHCATLPAFQKAAPDQQPDAEVG
jgi:maleylpyruvate isomerase